MTIKPEKLQDALLDLERASVEVALNRLGAQWTADLRFCVGAETFSGLGTEGYPNQALTEAVARLRQDILRASVALNVAVGVCDALIGDVIDTAGSGAS